MTKYVVDISGEFRNSDEEVFDDQGRCIFIAPPPYLVPSLMDDLFNWMQDEKDNTHSLILSCIFHYKFVFIHPFVMEMEELQDYGIQHHYLNGNQSLNIFHLKVK